MLKIDLSGKRAFIAGIGDDKGYGWAIAKALAQAGASISVGTWPPIYKLFSHGLTRGKFDMALPDGSEMVIDKVYPLDGAYDTPEDVPDEILEDKRYRDLGGYTVSEAAEAVARDLGDDRVDILVHALANAPEISKPLLETSRKGYLTAVSVGAYSLVSLLQRFHPLMSEGGSVISLSFLAGDRVVPGYGGGMHAAKASLQCDTRVLAYEAGRKNGVRVNTISAGPLPSRAAKAIGNIDKMCSIYSQSAALRGGQTAEEVAYAAAFLCSPLAGGITGETLFVDRGYHVMALPTVCLREHDRCDIEQVLAKV